MLSTTRFGTVDDFVAVKASEITIRCVVILGTTPAETDRKRSFELFRNNLHDVLVITFDELIAKLQHLHHFLSADNAPKNAKMAFP